MLQAAERASRLEAPAAWHQARLPADAAHAVQGSLAAVAEHAVLCHARLQAAAGQAAQSHAWQLPTADTACSAQRCLTTATGQP